VLILLGSAIITTVAVWTMLENRKAWRRNYVAGYAAAVDSVLAEPPSMMPPLLSGYRYIVVPPDSVYPKMIVRRVK
jgi:hypothetical protein